MATPNSSLTQLGISDVNLELQFASNTARAFDDAFFRGLTGQQGKMIVGTPILMQDVSSKSSFDGVIAANSVNVSSYGTVTAEAVLSINSDLINPDVVWSYSVISGNTSVTFQPDGGKNATLRLVANVVGVQVANVQVNTSVSFLGQPLGTLSRFISLSAESFNPALVVSGNSSVNVAGFIPQIATTTMDASSNVVGGVIQFRTSPPFGGSRSGNTITFSAVAATPGVDNNMIFTLTTDVLFNNTVVASNNVVVNTRAVYSVPGLTLNVPATTNNVFANTGPINSSIVLTSEHAVAAANIEWSYTLVSGDIPTLTPSANLASANLSLAVAVFGTKKSVVDVKATLSYANSMVLNERTQRLTLRTVGFGLAFTAASDDTQQGFTPQLAQATASASYQAGEFSWDTARISGLTANTSGSDGAGVAAITLSISAPVAGVFSSVNRINPVLRYDGIVIANVSSMTTITAEFQAFTFSVAGPTVNTQIGTGTVEVSAGTDATFNVPSGYMTWSINNANVAISSNTTSANVSITTTALRAESVNLTGRLFDEFNRLVSTVIRPITLRAYAPNITFLGANNITVSGYAAPRAATTTIESFALSGANTFSITTSTISGDGLAPVVFAGNTSYNRVSLSANASSIGTVSGIVRLTATATYFGVSLSQTRDVELTASLLNPNYSLSVANGSVSSFQPPVTASADVTPTHSVPGGTLQWSTNLVSGPAVFDVPVANNTLYRFRQQRGTVGVSNTMLQVIGTLLDDTGAAVQSLSANVFASATVASAAVTLSGTLNPSVSNTFQATAATTLTASVPAAVSGESYQFSSTRVSGVDATLSNSTNTYTLSIVANGVGAVTSVYDVTVLCIIGGVTVSQTTQRVTLTATALAPSITFSSANSVNADYNFPVQSTSTVSAAMTPSGGSVVWTWALVSGSAMTVNNLGSLVEVVSSISAVGANESVYDVTATFLTPAGSFITSQTARVRTRVERFDPGFAWNYVDGADVVQTGWENSITATGRMLATANASMTGHTFSISSAQIAGATLSVTNGAANSSLSLSNDRVADGVIDRTGTYDVTCSVIRGSQTIAGPVTRRINVTTRPYILSLAPLNPYVLAVDSNAVAKTTASSNHESFSGTPITWSTTKTSGPGDAGFSTQSPGGINNRITGTLTPGGNAGTRTAVYTITANFFANDSTRTVSTQMTLEAERTQNQGGPGNPIP